MAIIITEPIYLIDILVQCFANTLMLKYDNWSLDCTSDRLSIQVGNDHK